MLRILPCGRALLPAIWCCLMSACGSSADGGAEPAPVWPQYERPASFDGIAKVGGLKIVLRDGIELSASVLLPADADGEAAQGPFPVILTQTGYNKSVPLLRTSNEYFVRRGYAHVSVDVRGTGLSQGEWEAFSETEQADYREVLDWVAGQPWSDGRIGTWGASFAAITQLFTAAHRHPAHKAVFAIVPMGDAYRDIVFTGGQINAGFIPLWMGLVTALGLIPAEPDPAALQVLPQHLLSALTNFQVPVIARSLLGLGDQNHDGPFWRTRSPLEVADRIRTPTFVVGGLNDIFQRGEPLLYEAIRRNTEARLLIGPWMHVAGSSGEGLPADGVPDLDHIALMWFDRHLLGIDSGADAIPEVTQYVYGADRYMTSGGWPHPDARAQRWYLGDGGLLTREMPRADGGAVTVLQQPLNGLCSTSTAQWTAGVIGAVPLPCQVDNRYNELLEATYTTAPMAQDVYIDGPIQADLWISTTAGDAGVLVRVTDVSPDGVSREITNGILTASLRAVDETRSRYLDGEMIQPWHPFTADSRLEVGRGNPVRVPVEVFPTSLLIRAGHRLRITVGASDFPHGLPPLPDLVDQAVGLLTIHSDAERPSSVVLPVVPALDIAAPSR
ncbi:MAG: CocE/NonD family hydrolase [Pseudomonadota bacterium]|nr:CocE/NonD family hydrolase [Pseudomonadota bacterium]